MFLLTACGTIKTDKRQAFKTDQVSNVDVTVKESGSQKRIDNIMKDARTNVSDKSVTRQTDTQYSAPDSSTGRQHKTRERTTETLNDIAVINEQNERIISEQQDKIDRLTLVTSQLRTKLDASLSEKITTTTRPPVWTYIVAILAGAALTLIIRIWLKRTFRL
ncbi:MAG TPA: hypothetical protein DEG28_06760 [Porphyromonadaceae bacterium]|nr:hypothetical protein [Porphyromonadaceae bacterium]